MNKYVLRIFFAFILSVHLSSTAQQTTQKTQKFKPNIQHGVSYQKVDDISQYYVSEKLDGIRGYWDGKQLFTRRGNLINSPSWFTQHWPTYPMDGELWLARGQFQLLLSCATKRIAVENKTTSCWRSVRFMIFDLPKHLGDFNERVIKMRTLLVQNQSVYLAMIDQVKLEELSALDHKLDEVIATHGEGLMLHLASAHYQQGRNPALMKLKKYQDAEATVIGYTEGKGKYQNQLGAIKVKTSDGIIFKIGSGLSDIQRANPPKIGTIITFKYNGLTQAGIPRFARFWRIKASG
ncbi:DNA ligase [Colwellia psychrerythraea]|uniref:DNA ligase, ATP-dependent n=1 Tax=Colwellia psychrerythraea (strain 34H / ATCC BAA-681) TaxID=167879 RepID=Q47VW9_COLP3|nr:DNA ligase [Colwellia psychrerythraea]AAZ28337.1 DNA ligase, ATP-dependent [Colwellia psychrerythraea 34H]